MTTGHPAAGALGHRLLLAAQILVGVGLVVAAVISDQSDLGRLFGAVVAAGICAVLTAVTARGSDVARGTAALIGGILGVGFGGGIGPAWLATTGVSLVAILEIVALIAGLTLLVAGAWLLVRVLPGWWRLAADPGRVSPLPVRAASPCRSRLRDAPTDDPALGTAAGGRRANGLRHGRRRDAPCLVHTTGRGHDPWVRDHRAARLGGRQGFHARACPHPCRPWLWHARARLTRDR